MKSNQLILLHGALGSKNQLAALAKELSKSFDVYFFNFEGHGGNITHQNFSIELFTTNLKDYIVNNKLEGASVFGYSMGGYVALNLALQHPELINGIVTFGTKFDWTEESTAKEILMLNPEMIEEKVPKFAAHLQSMHLDGWKEVLLKTGEMMLNLGRSPLLNADQLNQINNPVTIGIGSEDSMVSIDESNMAAQQLANGKLEILDGFVHPLERNEVIGMAEYIKANLNS